VVDQGAGEAGADGTFTVRLDVDGADGLHRLRLAAYSDEVATVVEHTTDLELG
jgi:hypothetical protein